MKSKSMTKREYEALSDFRYQLRRFLRFSESATRKKGITHLQYLLLLHLKGHQGREWATVGELAERLQAHHHGVVALVSRCEKLELVRREPGRHDRREVEVHLTPKGEKLVETLARLHRDELLTLQGIFKVPGADELSTTQANES
ncbi:MarR family winged helix-turn-helix transcriptional regulator [Sulfuritortus calidifontis]|nr:MarR family transcriptional regulator [Sulfuritortus calidifontis]